MAPRVRAEALGDLAAVAVLDLQRAATHNARWEPELAAGAAARCAAASRRFRLPTLPKALVLGAAALTYLDDTAAAEAAMVEALTLAPDDTHLLGEVHGVRAYRALGVADDDRALPDLDQAMAAFARRPNEVTGSPAVGLWILLRTATDPALRDPPPPPDPPAGLRALAVTSREADVLVLVAEGRSNREIAERLDLSPRTVEKHVERLLAKAGLASRTELIVWAGQGPCWPIRYRWAGRLTGSLPPCRT